MTYNVFGGTLNLALSIHLCWFMWYVVWYVVCEYCAHHDSCLLPVPLARCSLLISPYFYIPLLPELFFCRFVISVKEFLPQSEVEIWWYEKAAPSKVALTDNCHDELLTEGLESNSMSNTERFPRKAFTDAQDWSAWRNDDDADYSDDDDDVQWFNVYLKAG